MSGRQELTDRKALARNRMRGRGTLLHELAIDDIQERLGLVNRAFTAPAIVTPRPRIWSKAFPGARIVADTPVLELQPQAHDLLIHAVSLHWADDPLGQLIQARAALKPDGLFLAVFPGGRSLHELRASLAEAELEIRGGISPRVLPMADIRDLGALLQHAGFALPVVDSTPITLRHESPLALMHDLRANGEANALAQRDRHFTRRAVLVRTMEIYAENFGVAEGIPATLELMTLTAWAPGPDQPRPLRPGSAEARLADALGTQEHRLSGKPHGDGPEDG